MVGAFTHPSYAGDVLGAHAGNSHLETPFRVGYICSSGHPINRASIMARTRVYHQQARTSSEWTLMIKTSGKGIVGDGDAEGFRKITVLPLRESTHHKHTKQQPLAGLGCELERWSVKRKR